MTTSLYTRILDLLWCIKDKRAIFGCNAIHQPQQGGLFMKRVLLFFKPTNTLLKIYHEDSVPIEVFNLVVKNPENYQVSLVDPQECSANLLCAIKVYLINHTGFRLSPDS